MKKIETATGKVFSVLWCGESTIDGRLRFCISGAEIAPTFNTFSDPTETEEIKYYVNDTGTGEFKTFLGFTVLQGVNSDRLGTVVVALAKGD